MNSTASAVFSFNSLRIAVIDYHTVPDSNFTATLYIIPRRSFSKQKKEKRGGCGMGEKREKVTGSEQGKGKRRKITKEERDRKRDAAWLKLKLVTDDGLSPGVVRLSFPDMTLLGGRDKPKMIPVKDRPKGKESQPGALELMEYVDDRCIRLKKEIDSEEFSYVKPADDKKKNKNNDSKTRGIKLVPFVIRLKSAEEAERLGVLLKRYDFDLSGAPSLIKILDGTLRYEAMRDIWTDTTPIVPVDEDIIEAVLDTVMAAVDNRVRLEMDAFYMSVNIQESHLDDVRRVREADDSLNAMNWDRIEKELIDVLAERKRVDELLHLQAKIDEAERSVDEKCINKEADFQIFKKILKRVHEMGCDKDMIRQLMRQLVDSRSGNKPARRYDVNGEEQKAQKQSGPKKSGPSRTVLYPKDIDIIDRDDEREELAGCLSHLEVSKLDDNPDFVRIKISLILRSDYVLELASETLNCDELTGLLNGWLEDEVCEGGSFVISMRKSMAPKELDIVRGLVFEGKDEINGVQKNSVYDDGDALNAIFEKIGQEELFYGPNEESVEIYRESENNLTFRGFLSFSAFTDRFSRAVKAGVRKKDLIKHISKVPNILPWMESTEGWLMNAVIRRLRRDYRLELGMPIHKSL
ncbi:MAG: hypothetical protein ACYC69_02590 [Thermodesulfovibrionales bacterium]